MAILIVLLLILLVFVIRYNQIKLNESLIKYLNKRGIEFYDDLPVGTLSKNKVFYEKAPYDSLRQKGEIIRKHFKESNND